jgi:uncharacterized protein
VSIAAAAIKRWIALLAVASFAAAAQAPIPPLTARVTDQTSTLTPEQKAGLEETLRAFEARKGSQIAVLMVPSAGSEAIEQYALRVAEQWKIGRKKVDDGAILVIAKNDRALRIEVGYGLEGALNDATSKRIISEVIIPRFREGDFYGGITAGVDRMIRVIEGEALPAPPRTQESPASGGVAQHFPLLLIGALVIGGFLRAMLGRFMGSIATGGIVGYLAWMLAGALFVAVIAAAIGFFFTLLGGGAGRRSVFSPVGWGGRGGFGGGLGGGGFRGGGGGFGGGGGGFGGGGASGRW